MVVAKHKNNKKSEEFLHLASSLYSLSEYEQTVYNYSLKDSRSFFDTCIIYYQNSKNNVLQALLWKYINRLGT